MVFNNFSSVMFISSTLVILSVFSLIQAQEDDGPVCYFPIEYQGTFLMQEQLFEGAPSPVSPMSSSSSSSSLGNPAVSYSEITIEVDTIPIWGRCYRKRGNLVILKDSTGREDCMRCVHLSLKTPNVLQLHSEGLSKCYTNEEAARAKCPTESDVNRRNRDSDRLGSMKEIMLYRKHIPGGLQSLEHEFCPFNGRYSFNHIVQRGKYGATTSVVCESSLNELGNCPHGDALAVKFRNCPSTSQYGNNMDMSFLCLGDWDHPYNTVVNGERYVALMDLRESPPDGLPKYRCGLYREEVRTGKVFLSLSSDSTCLTHLKSSTSGFESFVLTPNISLSSSSSNFPDFVEASKCRFPEWTQAKWEASRVEGSTFTFKDKHGNFSTLTSKCIMRQTSTSNERYVVYTQTQCNDFSYRCVWFKKRSPNILEFQFGQETSSYYNDNLCDDKHFPTNNWITQGRVIEKGVPYTATPCPITGDYSGVIPGVAGLCAKVASDCNNPDIMFYTVTACDNRSHVLEEREYRCLGNWEEDSILYTYTARKDMAGHQCFAGKINRSGEEAFIKEAGESCVRGEDPLLVGMNITKEAPCPRITPSIFRNTPSSRVNSARSPPVINVPVNGNHHHNTFNNKEFNNLRPESETTTKQPLLRDREFVWKQQVVPPEVVFKQPSSIPSSSHEHHRPPHLKPSTLCPKCSIFYNSDPKLPSYPTTTTFSSSSKLPEASIISRESSWERNAAAASDGSGVVVVSKTSSLAFTLVMPLVILLFHQWSHRL